MSMMFARRRAEYVAKLKARKAAEQKLAKAALVAAGAPLVQPDKQPAQEPAKAAPEAAQEPKKAPESPAQKPAEKADKKGK